LAEEQKQWELAINIYLGLRDLAPASRDSLDRKITRLRELAGSEKADNGRAVRKCFLTQTQVIAVPDRSGPLGSHPRYTGYWHSR
jgi:hypothetical protein